MTLIEDYGLIGDLQTAALVSRTGTTDWCCFPRFDSGACFAAILGAKEHGRWLLSPLETPTRSSRRYRHDTLIVTLSVTRPRSRRRPGRQGGWAWLCRGARRRISSCG